MRMERGVAALAIVAGLLSLACDTTSPSAETAEQAALTLPPINPYIFSAVVNPGCQDTGYGINDSGAVIGHSACLGVGAFVKRGTVVSSLPRPAGLGTNGSIFPLEINQGGRIVGYSAPGDGTFNFRALQWTPSGSGHTVSDLGTLAGGAAAEARAINAAGDVVGWSEIAMAGGVIRKHGFLRRANGTRIDLVPANGYLNAEANDINAAGFVVGKSYTPIQGGAHSSRATIWKPASSGSNTLLPVLLPGDFLGLAMKDRADFSADAVTRVTTCCFRRAAFHHFLDRKPHLLRRLHAAAAQSQSECQVPHVVLPYRGMTYLP